MANPIESEKFEVIEKIGHGSFGIIHKVKRKADSHILCRKEINYVRMSQKEREQLHAEFSILSSLRHPNIVAYYHREHLKSTQDLHIYMEYCGGGDLSKVIKNLLAKNQYAEEEFVWSIFAQLVTALYRCHYGVDPPDVGKNIMGPSSAKPLGLRLKNQVMILHRDLKPENVFLGADNSVKLGDFGLSKLMQSNDFANTYVGTPFYMSPEICAGEKYTLHSDIWSLGCIMYELCARHPPFNARTHFELVQKIKAGRVDPLPSIYSVELQNVIKSCLKTNPLTRPDTATLLQLPIVRLLRKEKEVVEIGRVLKLREEQASEKGVEMKARIAALDSEKEKMKSELESIVRREWEVKARLEIDRQIQLEMEKLHKKFELDVQFRVELEVQRQLQSLNASQESASSHSPIDHPFSSVSTYNDEDFPSTTDLSSFTMESPLSQKPKPGLPRKSTRTPFARAKTQYDSPMDIQMAEPSPMSIASLSLSPRRTAVAAPSLAKNIFAAAAAKWQPHNLSPPLDDSNAIALAVLDEEPDDLPDLPSPTRPSRTAAANSDPFKYPTRPGLLRQKTAPMQRLHSQPALFALNTATTDATTTSKPPPPPAPSPPVSRAPKPVSPNRRLSKLPIDTGSPLRRAPKPPTLGAKAKAGSEEMMRAVLQKNMLALDVPTLATATLATGPGRTLVELAQARGIGGGGGVGIKGDEKKGGLGKVAEWDPERDEMPSPFIARGRKGGLGVELRR